MEIIKKEEFREVKNKLTPEDKEKSSVDFKNITATDLKRMVGALRNPVESQKELAARVGFYLQNKMDRELNKNGILSSNTLAWIKTYNEMLDKLHKNIYGDKSTSLKVVVSHSDISNRIRDASKRNNR